MTTNTPTMLRHDKVDLALWELRAATGDGHPLLLLHGLGESSRIHRLDAPGLAEWTGPIYGLDFVGHGSSSIPTGGGYYCEILMGDVDIALAEIGPATVLGRGLGGYVALMIAGGRPSDVRGTVICDGPGLNGGGEGPTGTNLFRPARSTTTPDPVALAELATDVRPRDYARQFAWTAAAFSDLRSPISVAARNRPPWLEEVVDQPGVVVGPVEHALPRYA